MEIDYMAIETALKTIIGNPWLLTFAFLWVIGWYLKEHTKLNNKLIPTVILLCGAVIGIVIIQKTLTGAILGVIMAYIIIAFYEHIKNTIEFLTLRKKKTP